MKRLSFISFFALALVACNVNEVSLPKEEISFQTIVGYPVKANSVIYPQDCPFVGSAFYLAKGDTDKSLSQVYIPESTISYQNGLWCTERPYYWPSEGELTFISYSPASVKDKFSITNDGVQSISIWDSEIYQQDFMLADIRINQQENPNGVPTVFHHMLSKIHFSILVDGDCKVKIYSISLGEINTQGSFSALMPESSEWGSLQPTWGEIAAPKTLSFYNEESPAEQLASDGQTPYGLSYLAIPQAFADQSTMQITYDFYDGTAWSGVQSISKQLSLIHANWAIGKDIEYLVKFTQNDHYIEFEGIADDQWEDSSSIIIDFAS